MAEDPRFATIATERDIWPENALTPKELGKSEKS